MRALRWGFKWLTLGLIALWPACWLALWLVTGPGGCTVHEGAPQPCTLGGTDLSAPAYGVGLIAAWGPLILGPQAMVTGAAWAIVAWIIRKREARTC